MDQSEAPLLTALAAIERHPIHGFGAPGHNQAGTIPTGLKRLIGKRAFEADVLTPKGLDDRTEGAHALQRAHEIASQAWGADLCRFVTGGSTQSLHTAISALVRPGETVLIAANAHKAERAHALAANLDAVMLPVEIDAQWDIEHGVAPATLARALDDHPHARAIVVVSPSYYGVTSDIAGLAEVAHARGVPLIVDAAWGGAFAFSSRLPDDALAAGADIAVSSLHKTMGALAQGSVLLAKGGHVDLQRLWLAYELFETTSPSIPIMASLDATRRDHATQGEAMWADVLDLAAWTRAEIAQIAPLRVFGAEQVPAGGALDASKILIDVSATGKAGYAIDDWLVREHRISVGLSDARHLLAIVSIGTTKRDLRRLIKGLRDFVDHLDRDPGIVPDAPQVPAIGTLSIDMAMNGPDALFGHVEQVRYEDAEGRIAAEIVAPAPPGVPRLVPGQRISAAHVAWLVANRDAGVFVLDPIDPAERTLRVVAA